MTDSIRSLIESPSKKSIDTMMDGLRHQTTNDVDMKLDAVNQLITIPSHTTLRELHLYLRSKKFFSATEVLDEELLAAEVPWLFPAFADAIIASAAGVWWTGEKMISPDAPRSAAGSDVLGAILGPNPLAVASEITFRVIPLEIFGFHQRKLDTPKSKFIETFFSDHFGVRFMIIRGDECIFVAPGMTAQTEIMKLPSVRGDTALCSGRIDDASAEILWGFPYQGRLGTFTDTRSLVPELSPDAFCAALTRRNHDNC